MKTNRYRLKRKGLYGILRNFSAFLLIFLIAIFIYMHTDLVSIKSLLPVENISIHGNKHLTDDEIKILAGISGKENLLTISTNDICNRLLKSPWIKSVTVRKEFPQTLSLTVEEATPFALLDMNNRLFLVDEKGKFLEEFNDNSIPFLPIIAGDPYKEREGYLEALKLVTVMNEGNFASERDHIEIIIKRPHELTATIDGNIVKIGVGEYKEKLARL